MPWDLVIRKYIYIFASGLFVITAAVFVFIGSTAVDSSSTQRILIEIQSGEGLTEISGRLRENNLIHSESIFIFWAAIGGKYSRLKPGEYDLSQNMNIWSVLDMLSNGKKEEVEIVIPEGASLYEIDSLLSEQEIVKAGSIVEGGTEGKYEGYLFPDTYRFYTHSKASEILEKMRANFEKKAKPILMGQPHEFYSNLI